MVNVPLTDKGTFNVTPIAFELLTVNEVKLAVSAVAKFLNTPVPEMVCALVETADVVFKNELNVNELVCVKVPLFTKFPANVTATAGAYSEFAFMFLF
jgi:hypothetical protein